jgi:hypothetical protein
MVTDDMTDATLNRWATEYMGGCWHEFDYSQHGGVGTERYKCVKCGTNCWGQPTPGDVRLNYLSDSSPRSLVADLEKKVIEEKGDNYFTELSLLIAKTVARGELSYLRIARATSKERVLACWRTVNGE